MRGFKVEICQNCGKCLDTCVYVPLSGDDAIREHKELVEGGAAATVMRYCSGCGACDVFCPNDAHPYFLILDRLNKRYEKEGFPLRGKFLMPTLPNNFREFVLKRIGSSERALIDKWKKEKPEGEFLYPGCNFITLAYLANSPIFERLKIAGSLDLCCGEMYFRAGMFDDAEKIGKKLKEYYSKNNVKRMVFVCAACQNMFENVYPKQFGIDFDFEKISLWRWIIEHSGEYNFLPLGVDVAVHDSCHGRILGKDFQDDVRKVFNLCGVNVRETASAINLGYCCGMGACAVRLSLFDLLRTGHKAIMSGKKAKAHELATYCGGCLLTLSSVELLSPVYIPIHHLLDYVAVSTGGKPLPYAIHRERAAKMIWGMTLNVLPKYLTKKRFKLEKV